MSDKPTVHHLVANDFVLGQSSDAKPLRRRQRKPTLSRALREAKRAGVNVAGATYEDGKVSLQFGEPQAGEKHGNELDEWIEKHAR